MYFYNNNYVEDFLFVSVINNLIFFVGFFFYLVEGGI